jgi:hypothetical protein
LDTSIKYYYYYCWENEVVNPRAGLKAMWDDKLEVLGLQNKLTGMPQFALGFKTYLKWLKIPRRA